MRERERESESERERASERGREGGRRDETKVERLKRLHARVVTAYGEGAVFGELPGCADTLPQTNELVGGRWRVGSRWCLQSFVCHVPMQGSNVIPSCH